MKTLIAILPYLLSVLSVLNIGSIWLARKAILRGNWLAHRNFMVLSLGMWGVTLFLLAFYLWMRGIVVLSAVPEYIFGIFSVSLIVTIAMLVVTLVRVVKHQFLPHKLLARKAILVWLWTCALGILFYPLIDAHVIAPV
ncbi:MAG: hypothetical protein GY927_01320 [bacterium]|nr:hypothetical protein [bacterium]